MVLPLTVQLVSVAVPPSLTRPPLNSAELPLTVQLAIVSVTVSPRLNRPPPK